VASFRERSRYAPSERKRSVSRFDGCLAGAIYIFEIFSNRESGEREREREREKERHWFPERKERKFVATENPELCFRADNARIAGNKDT